MRPSGKYNGLQINGKTAVTVYDTHDHKLVYTQPDGSDLRDIEAEAEKGNKECQLALDMNAYRIKKYIGSYAAVMNGLDAIVFTAGIGENSDVIRKLVGMTARHRYLRLIF